MTQLRSLRLEHLARLGIAARGLVYCLVGGLALLAAVGSGGGAGGGGSALRSLLGQPFGAALLGAVGVGLVFFMLWRVAAAAFDADGHGASAKGLGTRAAHVFSGLVNGALSLTAFSLALGLGAGGDDDATQDWTRWLLSQPFGPWLVGAVGAGVVAVGGWHVRKGFFGDVLKRLAVPADRRSFALHAGRVGYVARGATFGLIGAFLIVAALHSDSDEAKGLGGALAWLERAPYGWAPLGAVALGLVAFGVFGLFQARHRRIRVPDLDDARRALG